MPQLKQKWVTTEIELNGETFTHRYGMWPKQEAFHSTRARYIVFGGARGPGKSYSLSQHIFRQAIRWPGIPILLLRRDLKDLKATTLKEFEKVVPQQMYDPKYGGQHHKGENWYRFPNGSLIQCGELKDWESYKSATVGLIGIDELNEVEEEAYENLDPTLRWTTGEGICDYQECRELGEEFEREHAVHPFYQIVACTNPAPGWVKTRFWEPWKNGQERKQHRFIAATSFDNPSLPPDFIPRLLENHTHSWVQNYIHGDWSSFENMVWPSFNRGLNVWKGPTPFEHFTRIEGGIDYGGTTDDAHRTAAFLTGFTKAGQMVTFWEYSKQGGASTNFFEELAAASKRYRVSRWWADSSQHRANQMLRRSGINVQDAPRYKGAVKDGVNLVNRLIRPNEAGRPSLFVTEDCQRLLSGIESYQLDPQTGEPAKNQEDDEVNAWRYNIMGITKGGPVISEVEYTAKQSQSERSKSSGMMNLFREERRERLRKALETEA